jgi:hypothetical protein
VRDCVSVFDLTHRGKGVHTVTSVQSSLYEEMPEGITGFPHFEPLVQSLFRQHGNLWG